MMFVARGFALHYQREARGADDRHGGLDTALTMTRQVKKREMPEGWSEAREVSAWDHHFLAIS